MQNNNRIEQLLEQSKRREQKLSDAQKENMLKAILDSEPEKSIVEHYEPQPESVWQKWMKLFIGGTVVAVAAVAAVIFFTVRTDTQPQPATLADHNTNNSNQQPENQNSNTNQTPEQPTTQVAVAPRLEQYLLEWEGRGGGGSAVNYSLWTVDRPGSLSTERTTAPELELNALSEEEMQTAAAAFDIPADQLYAGTSRDNPYVLYVTSMPSDTTSSDCIYLNLDQLPVSRCVYINNHGFVSLEQTLEAAQSEGTEEALTYVMRLTGLSRDDLVITQFTPDENVHYDEYYTITAKYSPTQNIPFRPFSWTLALEQGRLRSLYGGLLFIDTPAQPHTYEVISSAVAMDRLEADLKRSTEYPNFVYILNQGPVWVGTGELPADQDVDIQVEIVELEYELFVDRDERDNTGNYSYRFLPVYRIVGTEQQTGRIFQAYIDATSEEFILKHYDIVTGAHAL